MLHLGFSTIVQTLKTTVRNLYCLQMPNLKNLSRGSNMFMVQDLTGAQLKPFRDFISCRRFNSTMSASY